MTATGQSLHLLHSRLTRQSTRDITPTTRWVTPPRPPSDRNGGRFQIGMGGRFQSESPAGFIGIRNGIRLLPGRGLPPLVKVIDRDKTTPPLECLAEGWPVLDPLRFGVDICKADFEVFGPIRHQAPPQYVEATFSGLGIVSDDRQRIGWRDIPTRREIRARPTRRDREDKLDLAYIGREADTATHRANITSAERRPKRGDFAVAF